MVSLMATAQLGILLGLVLGVINIVRWLCSEETEANQAQMHATLSPKDSEVLENSSKGYGRYKYCGLRDDPFERSEAPGSGLTRIELRRPDLGMEQSKKVSALLERVSDLKGAGYRQGYFTDPSTLVRYLRARNGKVAEAEKLIRDTVKWRKKHDIDQLFTHWNLAAYEECLKPWYLSGGLFGHSRRGHPVAYERLGRAKYSKLITMLPFDLMLKCDIVNCERIVAALEEDAMRRQVPLSQFLVVMDLDGFGWNDMRYSVARTVARLTENRTLLLTEFTAKVLVVRASAAAVRTWSLFKNLLDPGTAAKVEVVTAEKTPQMLRKYIDDANIPGFLGGSKCIDGDPECRAVLHLAVCRHKRLWISYTHSSGRRGSATSCHCLVQSGFKNQRRILLLFKTSVAHKDSAAVLLKRKRDSISVFQDRLHIPTHGKLITNTSVREPSKPKGHKDPCG